MDLPELALIEGPPPRRPVGRPRRGATIDQRRKHITVLYDCAVRGLTLAEVARRRRLSLSTVKRYRDAALGYDDPRVELVRRGLAR